jgi:hypothetical protein
MDYSYQNSTLALMYDLEFKQAHSIALKKSNKDKLSLLNLNSQFLNTSLKNSITYDNVLNVDFFKNNINTNAQFKINTLFDFTDIQKPFSSRYYSYPELSHIKLYPINTNEQTNIASSLYENSVLDDVEETADNLRVKNIKFPIRLIKGIINKHNLNILTNNLVLDKNVLFNVLVNKNDITTKIPQSESF